MQFVSVWISLNFVVGNWLINYKNLSILRSKSFSSLEMTWCRNDWLLSEYMYNPDTLRLKHSSVLIRILYDDLCGKQKA